MLSSNFTLHDILSLLIAVLLFPAVSIFPGYVLGWILDILNFRQRTLLAQYVIAIAFSNAFVPILLFLAFHSVSNQLGIGIVILFFVLWIFLQIRYIKDHRNSLRVNKGNKFALTTTAIWIAFCVFLLVDLQIGQRLYFNAAAHDFTTRTLLIEAITRTGVPPINPTYYPGHFERITELYYFWYILGSVIDTLGGQWVDARIALFAGIAWSGLTLMATIAIYLRVRNSVSAQKAWRTSTLGIQLLAVSGLDFVPVIAMMIAVKTMFGHLPFDGRIESWNPPIMSWLNALTWVPNHVTSMAACMIAILAIISSQGTIPSRRAVYVGLAAAAIGSALGLSLWVTFTFGIFLAVWAIFVLFQSRERATFLVIILAGVLGSVLASPFLMELLKSGGKSGVTGAFPISVYVRHFTFIRGLGPSIQEIVSVLLLPINYFFELGFYFVVALLWIRRRRQSDDWGSNSFWKAEFLLLATVSILLSFVKSTVLAIDDLGIRGWLLGQFILIIWAVDVLQETPDRKFRLSLSLIEKLPNAKRMNDLISILLIVGILTTALEAITTRFWTILVDTGVAGVPNEISPDTNLGARTYDARLAFEFIRDHTPQDTVIQNNPMSVLDRPSGLYGTRQMIIGDRTAYGVPIATLKAMSTSVGQIFFLDHADNWEKIDAVCREYSIQAIILADADPLWTSLVILHTERSPLYSNRHYAVFMCGNGF